MVPLLFTAASRIRPHQVLYCFPESSCTKLLFQGISSLKIQYPAAVTGGTCRSLTAVCGSVRCSVSHVPPFSVRPSQPALPPFGPLCKTSRDVLSSSTLLFFQLNTLRPDCQTDTAAQLPAVPGPHIHHIPEWLPFPEVFQVLRKNIADLGQRFRQGIAAGDVRRDQRARCAPEGMIGRERLRIGDIQRGSCYFPA